MVVPAKGSEPRAPSGLPLRVLLVEDSEEDALLLLRELRRSGYEPEHERVETSEAMREALAGSDWDVVLSDHQLPRLDSSEALELAREAGSQAPFIIVSGNIGVEAAIGAIKAGAYDYVMKDDLARLRVAVERGLEETGERRRAEKELGRRDAILDAVRFAANRLLGEAVGWEGSIRAVLRRLGESTGVSRVYVWENYVHEDGETRATHRFEWLAPGATPGFTNASDGSPPTDFPYRAAGFERLAEKLGRGEPIYGHAREFPEGERPLLMDVLGVLSIVIVPIFVEGRWWGFIGFDECEREWSAAEVGALGAAAGTLGAAIRRRQTEEKLRASEAELRAVFGAMNDVILVLDGEGRYLKVAPTTSSMLYRPPEELVGRTVHDTFTQGQADMILGSIRHSLETQERVDIEYGLRVLGQDMWFSATFSPMTQDTVVAVARVITEQAKMRRLLEGRVATLSRVAASLTLDQPMERTLGTLAESMVRASTAVACSVALIDDKTDALHLVGSHGFPEGYTAALRAAYGAGAPSPNTEVLRTRQPMLFQDVRRRILADPLYETIHHFAREVLWDTVYILPLVYRNRVLGAIHFCYLPAQEPGENELAFLQAVADQAAVAVENARLFAEVRGKAALEERQKLARELHDSVSQALYGIALGSKTAREEFDGNPAEVPELLDYVLSLAEAGMAEMRALIFELRPESLESEGVVAALEKLAAALEARHGIRVRTDLCEEPEASLEAKEAVYRIVQEALHNVAKHARASSVEVKMGCAPEQITLEICDDGVGFDPDRDFPGHLGLRSMRERAQRVDGTLQVESAQGAGTRVHAQIPH